MSCEYHVYCLSCDDRAELSGNHAEGLMHRLIRHRDTIARLVPLMDDNQGYDGLALETPYGYVDPSWFLAHQGHELRVRDEYGRIDGTCAERYICKGCGTQHYCRRQREHEGDHGDNREQAPLAVT